MSFDDTRFTLLPDGAESAVASKECKHCKQIKPRAEFSKHSTSADRLQSWCKECHRKRAAKAWAEKRAKKRRSDAQKRRWEKEKAERHEPVDTSATDPVNSPDHYKKGGIECIDAMVQVFGEEAVRTYARINAFKYIWRHQYKGKPEEDLAKAAWYTRFANGDDPRKDGAE
jgi:hypothetical protein